MAQRPEDWASAMRDADCLCFAAEECDDMKELTQEQILEIVMDCGLNTRNNLNQAHELSKAFNQAFAAGLAQGEKNSLSTCELLALDPYTQRTAADCVAAIKAKVGSVAQSTDSTKP
jgi:hypothetical protein